MNNEENENIIDTTNVDTNEDLVTHEEIVDDNIKINNDSTDDFSGVFHERDSRDVNNIVTEVKDSFLRYSMSVITSRALPDLRDGLKPVHRRILWSMYEEGNTPDKPHRKSATTVGNVMGHYHPHGDSSIYEAMVRLAQDFSQRYILVDGHGNFGNIDGDGAAAYRYTEARLSKLSLELLRDINKDTVDFMPNFDATLKEPKVLPSKFPNVLVNGSMGIAVGMATNMIGVKKRIIAFLDESGRAPTCTVMLNPEIVKKDGAYNTEEGCLSLLGGPRPCKRYKSIKVKYQTLELQTRIKTYTGWTAQVIQHEVDHCNGVLI